MTLSGAAVSQRDGCPRVLRFGCFALDVVDQELRRSGMPVRLQAQPLKVLVLLAQRPGQVVTREELRQHLWGGDTHVDFERGLNYCLSRVRSALGDDAVAPRFVETLPRIGYRFVAPVEPVDASPPLPARAVPAPALRRSRAGWTALAALGLILPLAGNIAPLPADGRRAEALSDEARQLTQGDRASLDRSVVLFLQALALDSDLRSAQIGLARAYLAQGERGFLAPSQAYPAARIAAQHALRIEERGDARIVLGRVALEYDWDWPTARLELERAQRLEPEAAAVHLARARYLSIVGRHHDAAEAIRRAEALAPGCGQASEEGWCHFRARRYAEAARAFQRDVGSRSVLVHDRLFAIYRLQGLPAQAVAEAREVMIHAGLAPEQAAALASAPAAEAIREFLQGSLRYLAARPDTPPDRLAALHAALGDHDAANAELERALALRSPSLPLALWDPDFDQTRETPEFARIARAVGVPAATGL